MRTYRGEVADAAHFGFCHRIIEVEADDVRAAHSLISEKKDDAEAIYQISRDFKDCELGQPVYDFFNGFDLAGREAEVETWKGHWQ